MRQSSVKEYHTDIIVNAPVDRVWSVLTDFSAYPDWNPLVGWLQGDIRTDGKIHMFIKPLKRAFNATLKRVTPLEELTWVGIQFAPWFLAGEHYYRLEKLSDRSTRLWHGETFSGVGSAFISQSTLNEMLAAFKLHDTILKERVENE